MERGQPSRTAWAMAGLEGGGIFSDPLAVRILGEHGPAAIEEAQRDPSRRRGLRLFVAVRARFAEDALASAVSNGVRQLVILGAGLDTYAYRTVHKSLRIFEADLPTTQEWKRQRLAEAGIEIPAALTFAPIDFECETLAHALAAAGFNPAERSFFTWLGLVPYLTERAIFSALSYVANLPGGTHVVFDYANPLSSVVDTNRRLALEAIAAGAAALGETMQSYFETDALRAKLVALGFAEIEDLGPVEIASRYLPHTTNAGRGSGEHVVHAATL